MLRMLLLLLLVFSVSAGGTATEHAGTYCTAVYGSTVSIFGTVVAAVPIAMLDARIVWLTQKVPSITRDGIVFTILGRKEAGSTDFGTRRDIVGGCVRCRRGMLEVTADLLQEPNLGSGANEANEASEANVASEASEQEKAISRGCDVFSLHPWHSACTCVAMIGSTPKWRPRVRPGGVVFLLVGHVYPFENRAYRGRAPAFTTDTSDEFGIVNEGDDDDEKGVSEPDRRRSVHGTLFCWCCYWF
ncbi:uncharacterized protein SEPMUDRAFT_108381 [Sphaerulina musiva SO2202]|uniref:Membrane-associated protein n=1 Tax=Sphaerulina musiva (strain SO2202) TaxID=692275 RepID=M3AZL0_SPHMS|nr:uncharacterized protein SEPMUDRAFT_108381 [Sphaerulina musiva SO2202]EMF12947.1 hypothetical protein SEPMUDRAFT_108381 [Sphaerulina musiva SO2202]